MAEVKKQISTNWYKKFDQIDGSHPLKSVIPEGYIDYPARIRKGGKVSYFNFSLAKEMGLIPKSHADELTMELKEKILSTFSIQIINEYDQMNNKKFPKDEIKAGTYMATRYLQLQHDDKKGRTSGDGRSIWNGQIKHNHKTWDISSCGTGATRLSPATSKYNKFFETGDPTISYGCGYAEFDEGLATAILSHIFNANQQSTEQTLAIIEFKNNISINVRVHENLLRPSHIFLYLKQDRLEELKSLLDYYIERQREKEDWSDCPSSQKKYDYLGDKIASTFGALSADLEDEYIFCWLDWDGDNILMDGGIIDYGSIRQFGLFHSEYRYDDVERYSTNILEQKNKAKYIVQTFAQAIDFIKTGEKKNINEFANSESVNLFDEKFEQKKNENILRRIGLSQRKRKQVLKRKPELIEEFRKVFSYFERAKSESGVVEISDGVTWDAIFSMRTLLREYPQIYLNTETFLDDTEFIDLIKSSYATQNDLEINSYRKSKIYEFQKLYLEIIKETARTFQQTQEDILLDVCQRSQVINKAERITGDAVTYIVDLLIQQKKSLSVEKLYHLIEDLGGHQNLDPDKKIQFHQKVPKGILRKIIDVVRENREGL
ncbi:MAG: hypothetical protein QF441_00540 [Bacteriovoracaceae bacterium]|jgi:uncharacterized protein YdiU (UPF0061 family)|nr:hypothetical protein [Halobacteriovoraceae bacterium]MDP7319056.1 hypothetical protein [Bacteriovoracaceae bacterium]